MGELAQPNRSPVRGTLPTAVTTLKRRPRIEACGPFRFEYPITCARQIFDITVSKPFPHDSYPGSHFLLSLFGRSG